MEIKKSSKADLEAGRAQRFLLGLVVALALLFVGLEYSVGPDDPLADPELLEQLESDIELPPLLKHENEISLAPKAEPEPTMKLVIAEEEDQQEEEETPEQPIENNMEGDMSEDDLPDSQAEQKADEVIDFQVVEDLPQFPGGPMEFIKWLTRNLKYPKIAQDRQIQGKVVVEFIVNKDGSVTDVSVVKPLHPHCDDEALRVLKMMPRWTAGIQNGKPCRTKVCIPIVFKL